MEEVAHRKGLHLHLAAFRFLILKPAEAMPLNDVAVGRIFPLNTLRFLPGILFNVNWLKVKERLALS